MKKANFIIIFFIFILILILLYNRLAYMNIIVKFDELEPFDKQMNVYYKGFKIGKTTKIYPDKEYQNTYLKIRLNKGKINLPENSKVRIKKSKSGGYVNIIYPDAPSLKKLRNNDILNGTITKDINSILEGKFTDQDIDMIVDDAASLIDNANGTLQKLSGIFDEVLSILQDVHPDIKIATSNLAQTSVNLKKSSEIMHSALAGDTAKISFQNIADTTENIRQITENIEDITNQINNVTIPLTNNVLCETKETMSDVSEISSGLKNTLRKQFGIGRLLFGRPVSSK